MIYYKYNDKENTIDNTYSFFGGQFNLSEKRQSLGIWN